MKIILNLSIRKKKNPLKLAFIKNKTYSAFTERCDQLVKAIPTLIFFLPDWSSLIQLNTVVRVDRGRRSVSYRFSRLVQALPLAHLELQGGGRQGVKLDVQNCPALAVLGVEVEASLPPTPW